MARKRTPQVDPPSASSEEEDEVSSDEEEDEEAKKVPGKTSTLSSKTPKNSKPQPSETDGDSESDDSASAAAVKTSKKASVVPSKRSNDGEASERPKKKPQAEEGASEEEKKTGGDERKLFQRLWSEEDEIVILKGMIDYHAKYGSIPACDNLVFQGAIKSSIQVEDFTTTQLIDKVRRLRKKYKNNLLRVGYVPSKPHDKAIFELSRSVWGDDVLLSKPNNQLPRSSKSSPFLGGADFDSDILTEALGNLPRSLVKKGLSLLPESAKAELLAKWEQIHVAEVELFVRRTKLLGEHSTMILKALKHG